MTPYWSDQKAGIVLYHGNALDVLPTLERVDHCITDPPYEAEAHTKGRRVKRTGIAPLDKWAWIDTSGTPRYECLDFPAIDTETRAQVSAEFGRLATRWVLVFSQAEGAHLWERDMLLAGLTRRRWCVWTKPDAQPQFSGDRPGVGYETIVACHAKGRSTWNGGGRVGVFRHNKSGGDSGHQTEKPAPLMEEIVYLFTDPGETILDAFCGSGTTLVAAKRLGRKAIGVELEEKWCEATARRLERTTFGVQEAMAI